MPSKHWELTVTSHNSKEWNNKGDDTFLSDIDSYYSWFSLAVVLYIQAPRGKYNAPLDGEEGECSGPTNRILIFAVSSFGLDSIVLTEGSIMKPCLRSGCNFVNSYRGPNYEFARCACDYQVTEGTPRQLCVPLVMIHFVINTFLIPNSD